MRDELERDVMFGPSMEATEDLREIGRMYKNLCNSIDTIAKDVEMLGVRIAPVMRSEPERDDEEIKQQELETSLGNGLNQQTERIVSIARTIKSYVSRIEL